MCFAAVHPAQAAQKLLEGRQDNIRFNIHAQCQAIALAILGEIANAMPDGILRGADVHPLAFHVDFAAIDGVGAKDGPRHLGAPGAHQPGKAQDLAFLQLEVNILDDRCPGSGFSPPAPHPGWLFREFRSGFVDRPADHHADDLVDGGFLGLHGIDITPIAHHRDPVGDLLQLFQAVGDMHHAHAFFAQLADHAEKLVDLRVGQRGGRLIHDQHAGIEGEGLGNFHHLLLGDGQVGHLGARVELEMHLIKKLFCLLVDFLVVQENSRLGARFASNEDILRHGQVGHQVELLVDHADAQVLGSTRVGNVDFVAFVNNVPGVFFINARQDFHQGRFAGAIFAHQGVHFAGLQLKLALVQRQHTREGLGNAL